MGYNNRTPHFALGAYRNQKYIAADGTQIHTDVGLIDFSTTSKHIQQIIAQLGD